MRLQMTVAELAFLKLKMGEWCNAYSFSMPYICLNYGVSIRFNHQYENYIDSP